MAQITILTFFSKTNLLFCYRNDIQNHRCKTSTNGTLRRSVCRIETPLFLSDWLKRLNVGKGTKISPPQTRNTLYNAAALFFLSPRNPRIISSSLRVDVRFPQHKFTLNLHCEHDDSLLSLFVACIFMTQAPLLQLKTFCRGPIG